MEYTNSQITELIKEYIHDKNDRKMLYLKLVDNDTLQEIGDKLKLDKKTVWRRLQKAEKELFSHIAPG